MARGASIFTLVVTLLSVIHYYAAGVLCNNYKLVYPKFYSTGNRFKRSTDEGSSLPDYVIKVEINEWILQYEKSDHFVFGNNFTVEYLNGVSEARDFLNIPECEFYYGTVKGLQSVSVVTVCEQEITGFIKSEHDFFFLQPARTSPGSQGAHILYSPSASYSAPKRRQRRDVGSFCFTTEFYNLTEYAGDTEVADDDSAIIELSDASAEADGNGEISEDVAPQGIGKEKDDPEETGYFYDSAWETHIFKKKYSKSIQAPRRWLEIAVGVDYSVIHFHGKNKVQRYILALLNIVSAIYQDPSLESNLQLVLTRMILYDHKKYSQIRERNARKSLENVNGWNKKLHSTLGPGEQRHDVAIWLTKVDIGGPSGYAPVAGACDPARSCTVNRDEGLTSAFIIAHEVAHVLGLTHDGDLKANNSCIQEANEGSVMAPMVAATFHKFSWSTCSKKEFHKRADNWYCLKNPPPGKTEVVLKATLRNSFSMDEQCRMEFGDGYQMCRAFDIIEPCSHLWCGHKNASAVCKTKKGPPLEGTECGRHKKQCNYQSNIFVIKDFLAMAGFGCYSYSNKAMFLDKPLPSVTVMGKKNKIKAGIMYCVNGYCELDTFGFQSDPITHNPQDGGWSNWTRWGPCSKHCGFGVEFRSRFCNNPHPAYGGSYCKGDPEEFEICAKKPCTEPITDFRAEQCARLSRIVKLKDVTKINMTWLPYESETRIQKCKLTCLSLQTGEIFHSGENLIDGTKCSYDDEGDICVQGLCYPLDCEGSHSKLILEDSCGICGGNNSLCVNLTANFQRNVRKEISRIGVVPRMARNIKIECRLNLIRNSLVSDTFLMMRDRLQGLRYNLTIPEKKGSNTFIIRGAKFHYSKSGSALKLWSKGPLLEEIIISLFTPTQTVNSGIGMAISSSYSVRKDSIAKKSQFSWVLGSWGLCSSSCGGGRRIRTTTCQDVTTGRVVLRRFCSFLKRPPTVIAECNKFSCRFHWTPGEWEPCTATCGSSGTQQREIYCVHYNIKENSTRNGTKIKLWQYAVNPNYCTLPKLDLQKFCNRIPCPAHWEASEWSMCSASCGVGEKIRDYQCVPPQNETVYTCGPKPKDLTQKCRVTRKENPLCRKKRTCTQELEICELTDYLSRYCVLKEFRKLCCKSCFSNRVTTDKYFGII